MRLSVAVAGGRSVAATGDELAFEAAPFYFEFGSALLDEISRTESLVHADANDSKSKAGRSPASPPLPCVASGCGGAEAVACCAADGDDSQVSWENLDVARVIYSRRLAQLTAAGATPAPAELKEVQNRLGEVHSRLADHSLETGAILSLCSSVLLLVQRN